MTVPLPGFTHPGFAESSIAFVAVVDVVVVAG